MFDRVKTGVRILLPILTLAAISLAVQAGQRWMP
jgi:hypothetical protein